MFCTSLRSRAELGALVQTLSTSQNPKLQETKLQTHDLALETSSIFTQQPHRYHLFLILTAESITSSSLPETLARITRFSTLTTSPSPTVAFLLSAKSPHHNSAAAGLNAYTMLQSRIWSLPSPPTLLPISTSELLLPLLSTYLNASCPSHKTIDPPSPRIQLLPHATTTVLSEHATHVVSDLCRSMGELVTMARQEDQEGILGKWIEGEAEGIRDFWASEWIRE